MSLRKVGIPKWGILIPKCWDYIDIMDHQEYFLGDIRAIFGFIWTNSLFFRDLKRSVCHFSEQLFWPINQIWGPLYKDFAITLTVGIMDDKE